ncbi:MAG: SCP2 sterol-binding domain-containing protein [Deltaproteobacteria bacterium]|nr:SCP2 sterol-binding domain-containing protein [Deltaproteobacteria bacterium]
MSGDGAEEIKKRLKGAFYRGIRGPLKAMPLWMEAIGVGAFIATIVEGNPPFKEKLSQIDGKVFRFEAKDIGKSFYLHIKDREIKVVPHIKREPDVTMSGKVAVLMDVLTGKEDPDTVFFSRRLEITGDTATAIYFKNMLAALG